MSDWLVGFVATEQIHTKLLESPFTYFFPEQATQELTFCVSVDYSN